ncbi:MAG: Gfo/Idh/MocA family oxidoreductase [Candidatus Latescibacterota bacterium]
MAEDSVEEDEQVSDRTKVGVIGCGNISPQYLKWMPTFEVLEVAAVADLDMERARARATEFCVPRACTVEELLQDPEIEIVVNLTVPAAHAGVNTRILEAGKHAYAEKPFALERAEGKCVLELAAGKGLRTGGAPDTFLGGGIQTCRKLLDDGAIGEPVAATAFMMGHGPEGWHPNPDFYYQKGGGPMFDMGPYYLTALVALVGPVQRVTGCTSTSFAERTITNPKLRTGEKIPVCTPTHIAGAFDFASGAVGTIVTSFDVWAHTCPRIEVHGTEGSMSVPDPNTFRGPVKIRKPGDADWTEVPLTHSDDVGRGIAVADIACALRRGRAHRASGELAYHVLDVMRAFHDASDQGRHVEITSGVPRPAVLPVGLGKGELD